MTKSLEYSIGATAYGTDGVLGRIERLIVDPNNKTITHLVVEPKHRNATGRLVPITLASTHEGKVQLPLTTSEFTALEQAEQRVPSGDLNRTYSDDKELQHIYYELSLGGDARHFAAPEAAYVSVNRVPDGEVEVHRGDHVYATDGAIGHVRGLIMNSDDRRVTHILLDEGHLWGHKEVAIPIECVTRVADGGALLSIAKCDVENLPSVAVL